MKRKNKIESIVNDLDKPCIEFIQENSIENFVQDCLSYILLLDGPCELFIAYSKQPCVSHIV